MRNLRLKLVGLIVRHRLVCLIAVAAMLSVLTWYKSGYMPGTLRTDPRSKLKQGTGAELQTYDSGNVKATHSYLAGHLRTSTWYRPDGSVVATTRWSHEQPGTSYFLREDGSIYATMECNNGVANGTAVFFDKRETILVQTEYCNGVPADPSFQTPPI